MHDELYRILGVPKNATQDEIKQSYRTLSKKHHPDAGGDVEEFKRIAGAYQVLEDAERRVAYDKNGTTRVRNMRQEKKAAILQVVVDQKANEYVLNPLQKLIEIEEKTKSSNHKLKQMIDKINADINKLRKNKKSNEMETVLGVLGSIKSANEWYFEQAKMELEICQELISEFKKACKILDRRPEEVGHYVRMAWGQDATTSSTGGV